MIPESMNFYSKLIKSLKNNIGEKFQKDWKCIETSNHITFTTDKLFMHIDKVWGFVYTDCIYENSMKTMSLHRTKRGAYNAMNKYLNDRFTEERNLHIKYGKHTTFDHVFEQEAWNIIPMQLKE